MASSSNNKEDPKVLSEYKIFVGGLTPETTESK